MPGPGGGGHGGGGGRGGSFGGGGGGFHGGGGRGPGFGGGGFHGGPHHRPPHHPPHHHHPHHRPHWGGWHFGGWYPRRHYYGGGGCLGAIMAPVILVLFLLIFLLSMCQNGADISVGGEYNEEQINDYADDQYAKYFSGKGAYEDNLVIVVLTEENLVDFSYIAWKGDHIHERVQQVLGNNSTELGLAMNSLINESNYKYSLDADLANVMQTMATKIAVLELSSCFTCSEERTVMAKFVNNTDLPMTESTVQSALEHFAEATGIPVVLVVEDAADVFIAERYELEGMDLPWGTIVAVIAVVVVLAVTLLQRKKQSENT